ncbi:putative 5'-3' exonuclease [Leishmania major strain Friedlin]|uniref:Putative 5'-3' exonuclease n=1 Tax=Leishmania major TaxID=5664 RepID=Q4QE76_LEIMA|nr:putative 5'-3' exonuclease [Leishmania major strain Friedlin]CAG9572348.1 5'-3'_exoribonuclease_B_-_putative [Leishmania major strain Friedlin]CAJ03874.1 putative 5'-3' exonuclease [Leishmania major strain Friedlin]|eukprot:XP_001682372.1 putative 5'-3' exonuclease [Leishmania major strain Friedlin]
MGVPKFAAWLARKYPSMVMDSCPGDVHGLYIDLNGLIHPCCHDEHDPSVALRTQEEKLRSICLAIETLVVTVRPQRVIYIAIDGVVPRAKMNQQRARRYMSSAAPLTDTDKPIHGGSHKMSATIVAAIEKEFTQAECDGVERELADVSQALMGDVLYGGCATMALAEDATEKAEAHTLAAAPWTIPPTLASEGKKDACCAAAQVGRQPAAAASPAKFDSNCISPGTAFMDAVATAVRDYIRRKLAPKENDAGGKAEAEAGASPAAITATCAHWAGLTVIFSDSNTAGEGEHKISDFLRTQSAFPGFNGSGCHVIAGLDADLIFLSLSLHIPRVVILRDHKRSSYEQALLPDTAGGTLVTKKVSPKAKPWQVRRPAVSSLSMSSIGSAATPTAAAGDEVAIAGGTASMTAPSDDEADGCGPFWRSETPSSPASPATMAPATAPPQHIADMVVEPSSGYEYFDVDVVGASVVSEVYQLCLENGMQLRGDPLECADNCVSANGFCFHRYKGTSSREVDGGADVDGDRSGDAKAERSAAAKGGGKLGGTLDGRPKAPLPPFHPCTSTSNSKIIDDFIALGVLLGNDFLPHLPSVYCGESAMDTLMDVYVRAVLPYGYLTGGEYDIQLLQLERLLRAYAAVEAARFRQFAIQSGAMTLHDAATPELCSAADRRCWRDVYVRTTSLRDEAGAQAACRSYVEGMRFVWRYYSSISLQVSWAWYYPFHHAPLALDIADFLRAQGPQVQTTLAAPKLEWQPPSPFCQLLCILPPPSRQLVPDALRATMASPPAELADTFPHRWVVDRTGAYGKDHLVTVLLPFADVLRLQELVAAASGTYTEAEQQRNALRSGHLVFEGRPAQLAQDSTDASTDATPTTATTGNFTDLAASERADPAPFPTPRRASPARKEPPVAGSAAAMLRGYRIQGSGLSTLSAGETPADMRDCTAIVCSSLVEVVPPLSRPRTYSYTVPIPSLTVLPDGSRLVAERRPQYVKGGRRPRDGSGAERPGRNARARAASNNAADARAVALAMLFGEFVLCLVAMGILTAEATLWCALSTPSWSRHWPVLLQLCGIGAASVWLAFALGLAVAPKGRSAGSGLHRHSIFTAFADWQCSACLSVNFSRNRRCFICCAPYDPHRCVALFSSRYPPELPLMDPDHAAYAACYTITAV